MLRWTKWVAPMAALVLMVGFQTSQTRAQDAATPKGKATVTITVVSDAGTPVAGVKVGIVAGQPKKEKGATTQPAGEGAQAKPTPIASGTTGPDGTVVLTNIPNGKFVVMAHLKGAGNGRSPVVVVDDKDETVSVTLKAKKPAGN